MNDNVKAEELRMPQRYIGLKILKDAYPLTRGEAETLLNRSMGGDYPLDADGYLVTYSENDYQSWSPKDVLDAAYRPFMNESDFKSEFPVSELFLNISGLPVLVMNDAGLSAIKHALEKAELALNASHGIEVTKPKCESWIIDNGLELYLLVKTKEMFGFAPSENIVTTNQDCDGLRHFKTTIDELVNPIDAPALLCPFPIEIIPNQMGINLCNVDSIEWTRQADGQLVNFKVNLIPAVDGKNNATPSGIQKLSPIQYEIIEQLITAIDFLGGKSDITSILSSWGDTLPQDDILQMITQWNVANKHGIDVISLTPVSHAEIPQIASPPKLSISTEELLALYKINNRLSEVDFKSFAIGFQAAIDSLNQTIY